MKKYKNILILLSLILLSNCGYKATNNFVINDFSIDKIVINGDKKIGYLIKSEILSSSKENMVRRINIKIDSNSKKTVKEKNISNKILKYELTIFSNITVEYLSTKVKVVKSYVKSADIFSVGSYSDTLTEESKKIENLSEKIAEDIIHFLRKN